MRNIEQAAKTTGADLAIQAHLFQACEHKIALHVDAAISVVDTDPVEADSWAYEAGREAWDFDLKAPGKLAPYPVLSAAFKRGFDSVDQSRSQREMENDMTQSQNDDVLEFVMTMRSVRLQRETEVPLRVRRNQSVEERAAWLANVYGAEVVAITYQDGRPFNTAKEAVVTSPPTDSKDGLRA